MSRCAGGAQPASARSLSLIHWMRHHDRDESEGTPIAIPLASVLV